MEKSDAAHLTRREKDVLVALRLGRQYKEIACDLGVSLETVRHHIKNLYRKLKVTSRSEAIRMGRKKGNRDPIFED